MWNQLGQYSGTELGLAAQLFARIDVLPPVNMDLLNG